MKTHVKNDVQYLRFESFDRTELVNHGFSTRYGGVSTGSAYSMNLRFNNDTQQNVLKNYEIISDAIGVRMENMIFTNQVHDTVILNVGKSDITGDFTNKVQCDGLSTNESGVCLVTFYADCVPLFFIDTKEKAIALSHSGWKGTAKKMAKATIDHMTKIFGSKPKNIIAGIGPSIGGCCFEADYDCAQNFLTDWKQFVVEKNNKYHIDLWNINRQMLLEAGVDNISIAKECTKCNNNKYYSHRLMGSDRGSMAAIMELR